MDEKTISINLAKICDKKFRANYKNYGYNAEEVDQFLDLAIEINTVLKNKNQELNNHLIAAKQQINDLTNKIQTLENEILICHKKIKDLEALGHSVINQPNDQS